MSGNTQQNLPQRTFSKRMPTWASTQQTSLDSFDHIYTNAKQNRPWLTTHSKLPRIIRKRENNRNATFKIIYMYTKAWLSLTQLHCARYTHHELSWTCVVWAHKAEKVRTHEFLTRKVKVPAYKDPTFFFFFATFCRKYLLCDKQFNQWYDNLLMRLRRICTKESARCVEENEVVDILVGQESSAPLCSVGKKATKKAHWTLKVGCSPVVSNTNSDLYIGKMLAWRWLSATYFQSEQTQKFCKTNSCFTG